MHEHRAGLPLAYDSDELFSRSTDMAIRRRLGKAPLEVGANLIARTAVAALSLLETLRQASGRPIPLAWEITKPEPWRAIEVYPAATRIAHGALDSGGSLEGLDELIDCSVLPDELRANKDAVDACVCVLAAADFLRGRAVPPEDDDLALAEGWIWAP